MRPVQPGYFGVKVPGFNGYVTVHGWGYGGKSVQGAWAAAEAIAARRGGTIAVWGEPPPGGPWNDAACVGFRSKDLVVADMRRLAGPLTGEELAEWNALVCEITGSEFASEGEA